MKLQIKSGLVLTILALSACAKAEIDVKPIEVKPIQLTIDVNIRITKEVDESLAALKAIRGVADTTTTMPSPAPGPSAAK